MLNKYHSLLFIFGVFLMIYATFGAVIAGDFGKYFCLILGFILIFFSLRKTIYDKSSFYLIVNSIMLFLFFHIISALNEHQLVLLDYLFGLICLLLFNFGFFLSRSHLSITYDKFPKILLIIPIFSILGAILLWNFQSRLFLQDDSIRGYGLESDLNPVGVSFVSGLIFIINFSIFYKNEDLILTNKLLLISAQFASLIAMVSTLSRGSILYLGSFVLLFFLLKVKFRRNSIFEVGKLVIGIAFFLIVIFIVSKSIPFLSDRLDQLGNRFVVFFEFGQDSSSDLSSLGRLEYYEFFISNLEDFVFFGLPAYKPYPHNQFMEILMRWGLFGIPLLIFSIFSFFKGMKIFKHSILQKNLIDFLVISLFLFSYFQSMTSLSLEMNRFLWLGFGFVFGYRK